MVGIVKCLKCLKFAMWCSSNCHTVSIQMLTIDMLKTQNISFIISHCSIIFVFSHYLIQLKASYAWTIVHTNYTHHHSIHWMKANLCIHARQFCFSETNFQVSQTTMLTHCTLGSTAVQNVHFGGRQTLKCKWGWKKIRLLKGKRDVVANECPGALPVGPCGLV